jgi:hypothetical protein
LQGRARQSGVRWRAAARREAWLWLVAEGGLATAHRFIGRSHTKVTLELGQLSHRVGDHWILTDCRSPALFP